MKKFLLSLLFIAAALCASAQNLEVFVATISDLKTCLKSTNYTKITLLADMPDDEAIGDVAYDPSCKHFVGKKILNLNGHKLWAGSYMMYYTELTDTLVITGNGTWNCDGSYGFSAGDSEETSAYAGVLIIENGTFNYDNSYAFFTPGWNNWASRVQFIVNGGTFNLSQNYGSFIYCKADYNHSSGTKPKLILNDCIVNCKYSFFRTDEIVDVQINGGTYYCAGELMAAPFQNDVISIPSGKVAYIGGEKYTRAKLDYNQSNSGDMIYGTTFQIASSESDFIEVKLYNSSDGKVGLNSHYYGTLLTSGKFLKNSPFKLKAIATPNSGKNFNGWAAVKGTVIEDRSQKEVEFAIGENDIEMKAFFGTNMPTDFIQGNIHYFITYGNEVKVGSGNVESSDGLTPEELFNGNIVIPVSVTYNSNTYYVTSIADYAFYGRTDLSSVDCASGSKIQSVGAWACAGCTKLSAAWFEEAEDCSSFGEGAFSGCTNLTTFWLDNDMIYEIPAHLFENCSALIAITNWGGWSSLNSIGAYAFAGCTNLMNNDGSLWLEDAMMSYGDYAFANCKSFTNFTVPQYVNMLGSHVFDGCPLEWIKVPNPNAIGVFNDTSFPNGSTVCVPCDEYTTLMDPTWQTPKWNVIGYSPVSMMLSTHGVEDNEHWTDGYGTVSQLTNCSNITTVNATAADGNRFYRWQYSSGMTSTYNYNNPASYTYASEATITAEFLSPHQVLVDVKYVTEDGSDLPSDFGGVSLYLNKKSGTETAYTGAPTVWRKCEKYDEMDPDPSYINMTAKVGNVNDYRYEFVKWKNNNATTASIDVAVDKDTVLVAIIKELPKYTCRVSADPAEGGSVTLVYGDNVTEKQEYAGQPVKFYATPATGWAFSHWDNDLAKTDETLEILSLSQDETHVAHFKTQVTLTYGALTPGTGTVTANTGTSGSKYWSGTSVSLTPAPIDNYEFVEWSDGNTDNPRTEIVGYADATYTAIFNPIKCTVNVTVVPTGSATVTGAGEYDKGATANLSFIAAEGYEFVSWQREGAAAVTTETYAVPVDAKTINVTLTMKEIVKYTLKLHIESTVDQGLPEAAIFEFCDFVVSDEYDSFVYYESGMPLMEGKYKPETKVHISNYNPFGFVFDHWKDNNSTTFDRDLTMNSDITLTMVVRPVTYSVSAYAQDAKMGTVQVTAPTFQVANITDEEFIKTWKATYSAEANSGYEFVCWMNQSLYDIIGTGETPYETVDEYVADIKKDYDELAAKTDRDEEEEVYFQLCKFILSPSGEVGLRPMIYGDGTIDIDHATGEIKTMAVFKKSSATDIDNINTTIESRKFMENGVLFIQRNGRLYNAQGKLIK